MEESDFHEEADTLAHNIERTINRGKELMNDLPQFDRRSESQRRMDKVMRE